MTVSLSHIADGVLAVGAMAKKKKNDMEIIIMGLLHCDLNDNKMRSNVAEVNKILRRKCHKMNFTFTEQDADWIKEDSLNMEYYHKDRIHLNRQGNVKFANTIIRKLNALTSSSSFSSVIITRIPSSEVETRTNIFHSCPSPPPLPLNISSPIASGSSISHHSRVSSHIIDVPGPVCDYDHAKAMELMSSLPLCYVSFRQTCKRPQRKFVSPYHLQVVCLHRHMYHHLHLFHHHFHLVFRLHQICHLTSSQYHWSFHISCLSFLMMVLSYLTLPFSLMSSHFHQLSSLSCSQSESSTVVSFTSNTVIPTVKFNSILIS